jgi:uncharacterized protein (DUF2147 family)
MRFLVGIFVCAALWLNAPAAQADGGDAILGAWLTPKKDGVFEIYKNQNRYFGRLLKGEWKDDDRDINNPDPSLQDRLITGIDILIGFEFNAKKRQWAGGSFYDPEEGSTYDGKLWFDDDDVNKLNGRGFVGISLFGRTAVFERSDTSSAAPTDQSD